MTPGRLFYGFDAETVFDPQSLLPGESLLSLIARTTLENELPNITTILRDVGQQHRNRVVDVMRLSVDVEGLAIILGQDQATVEALRASSMGSDLVRYLGSAMRAGDVHTRTRRFAPLTLAADQVPFYRASWLVRTFPVCLVSWQALQTRCECGAAQTWATVSSLVHCSICGADLREHEAEVVTEEHRSGLTFLAQLLFDAGGMRASAQASLPSDLQALDPGEVYELALLIARIVDPSMPNPREGVWRDDPGRLARALAVAGPMLKQWPATPWLALEAAGNTKTMLPRSEPLKALHRVLNGDYSAKVASSARSTLEHLRSEIAVDDHGSPRELVDLETAAEILRVDKRKVRSARAAGQLGSRFLIRRGEILPAYSRTQLEALAVTVDWPSSAVAGKRIGVPPYGVEQLCAMDVFSWAKAPLRTLQSGLRVDPESINAVSVLLRQSATTIRKLAKPVAISAVMRGIGGREKPWGPVLDGLIKGRWPYALGRKGCVVREIYVETSDVDEIRRMTFDPGDWSEFPFSTEIHQIDACDILNVPNRSRHSIKVYAAGNSCGRWVFSRKGVIGIAADVVTSAELQARHLLETKPTMARIRRASLCPQLFGFERATAIRSFDRLEP